MGWLAHTRIVELGTEIARPHGSTIFSEGDASPSIYAVIEGTVRIEISTESGKRLVIARKVAGDIAGDLGAIDGKPRSATGVADGDVRLAAMSRKAFVELLHAEPAVSIEMMRLMSSQLRVGVERTAARNSIDITQRLSRRLVGLARNQETAADGDGVIDLRLTQDELAGWIGASREATTRALGKLRADGIVATARRQVTILDLARLEDTAR